MSYHLSLEETASAEDLRLDVDGIAFVAEARWHFALPGLKIDVQEYWGRQGLVAFNDGFGGSC